MNCRKCRARIFDYRDGTLSPREMAAMKAHMEGCPRCRAELEIEENLAPGLQESYRAATASLSFDPDKERLSRRENSVPSSTRSNRVAPAGRKQRVFRSLAVGGVVAILLAAAIFGPFKPGKRGAFMAGRMNDELSSLRSDDLPDPFQDWIQRRMIITIEDKTAGTTEKYLTDRAGTIRKIAEQGRN